MLSKRKNSMKGFKWNKRNIAIVVGAVIITAIVLYLIFFKKSSNVGKSKKTNAPDGLILKAEPDYSNGMGQVVINYGGYQKVIDINRIENDSGLVNLDSQYNYRAVTTYRYLNQDTEKTTKITLNKNGEEIDAIIVDWNLQVSINTRV
jgi:hypothetical protein